MTTRYLTYASRFVDSNASLHVELSDNEARFRAREPHTEGAADVALSRDAADQLRDALTHWLYGEPVDEQPDGTGALLERRAAALERAASIAQTCGPDTDVTELAAFLLDEPSPTARDYHHPTVDVMSHQSAMPVMTLPLCPCGADRAPHLADLQIIDADGDRLHMTGNYRPGLAVVVSQGGESVDLSPDDCREAAGWLLAAAALADDRSARDAYGVDGPRLNGDRT